MRILPPLVVCLYFLPATLMGRVLVSFDTTNIAYVYRRWFFDQLAGGELALWNEGVFGGVYLLNPILALFSPLNVLYLLVPGILAHQLVLIAHGMLAAWGMSGWVAAATKDTRAACTAGILYGLSGFLLSSTIDYYLFAGAAVAPFALWAQERRRWLALALGWVAIEGDVVGMCAVMGIACVLAAARGRARWALGQSALGLAVAAVALLPAFDLLQDMRRSGGHSYAAASDFSLHPQRLLEWVAPLFWGQQFAGTFWGEHLTTAPVYPRFWFESIYLGAFTLPLALLARRRLEIGLAALFLILALGDFAPLHGWLFELVAPYRGLRYPAKFYAFFALLVIYLAGVGMAKLRAVGRLHLYGAISYALAALLYMWVQGPVLSAVLLCILCLAMRWYSAQRAFVVIATLDLVLLAPALPLEAADASDTPSTVAAQMVAREHPKFRVWRTDFAAKTPRESVMYQWGMLDGQRYALGMDGTFPKRFEALMDGRLLRSHFALWSRVLGIQYILGEDLLPREFPVAGWHIVHAAEEVADGPAAFAALMAGAPAVVEGAVTLAPGHAGASLRTWQNRRLVFDVHTDAPALFILRDGYHAGWQAAVDGVARPVLRADLLNRAVALRPGDRALEFSFLPASFLWGSATTLVAILAALVPWALLARHLLGGGACVPRRSRERSAVHAG
jgi:hypothetical protein